MAWSGEVHPGGVVLPRVVGMMGPKCEREGIGQNDHGHHSDTTPFALPLPFAFIGGVVLAVPCGVGTPEYIGCGYYCCAARRTQLTAHWSLRRAHTARAAVPGLRPSQRRPSAGSTALRCAPSAGQCRPSAGTPVPQCRPCRPSAGHSVPQCRPSAGTPSPQ